MLDSTLSVCYADISNTNGRIRKRPVIHGLPALATASKLIRNEILSDIDVLTVSRHRVRIFFNLGKRMPTTNAPLNMSMWTATTHVDVSVIVRTIPGEPYCKSEAKNLPRSFSRRIVRSSPGTDMSVSWYRLNVDLRSSDEAEAKPAKLPTWLRQQLPPFYQN